MMKPIYFFIFCFCFLFCTTTESKSQERPLLKSENLWSVLEFGARTPTPLLSSFWQKTGNDTIIGGKNYQSMLFSDDENHLKWEVRDLFLREDSGKVYRYEGVGVEETLLYDFNLKEGDRISFYLYPKDKTYIMVSNIDSIRDVKMFNSTRRVFYISNFLDPHKSQKKSEIWIEGIGSSWGLNRYNPCFADFFHCDHKERTLTCCHIQGELAYQDKVFTDCYYRQLTARQMTVKIGNDTTFCAESINDGIELASQLVVENVVPPLRYKWSGQIRYPWGATDRIFPISEFLNDTTIANPTFKQIWPNLWSEFFLEVTDMDGNTARDSISVRFSQFKYPLGYDIRSLNVGDSILFEAGPGFPVGGGILPYVSCRWSPELHLSAPDQFKTWCKPTQSLDVYYNLTVVDSAGCVSSANTYCNVVSHRLALEKIGNQKKIYQKGNVVYFEELQKNEVQIIIYNINGVKMHEEKTKNSFLNLNELLLAKGVYICEVLSGGERVSCKVMKSK